MKRQSGLKSAAALLAALSFAPAVAADRPDAAQAIDAVIARFDSARMPGCVAGVEQGNAPPVIRAYGRAELNFGVKNTADTRFEVGSVSKTFTAASILMLVQDGKLKLDDDIRKYLPEMPDYGDRITIDNLLVHTSGIRDWSYLMEIAGWPRTTRAYSNNDVLHMLANQRELSFKPGADYEYSNSNYVLLAIIAERVTGMPFSEFTRTRIFEPLGMTSTSWRTNFQQVEKNMAKAYIETDSGFTERMPFENVHGDAGVITTVPDLLKWNEALSNRKLGQHVGEMIETSGRLADGRQLQRAHGSFELSDYPVRELSHGGSIGSYRAWIGWYPTQHLSVALICNNGGRLGVGIGRGSQFGHAITDQLLPPPPPPPGKLGGGSVSETGMFASEKTGMPVTLALDSAKSLTFEGAPLRRLARGRFGSTGSEIGFEAGDNAFTRTTHEGAMERYIRVQPATPTAEALADFTGRYFSPEVNIAYDVERSGDGLRLRQTEMPFLQFDIRPVYEGVWLYDNRFGKGAGVVRFEKGAAGSAPSFTNGWKRGAQPVRFTRVKTP